MRDPYDVLGVSRDATPDDIKRAYRARARENHPDQAAGAGWSDEERLEHEARFKEAGEAFAIIGDEEKRARWDRWGEASLDPDFDPAAWPDADEPAPVGAPEAGGGSPISGALEELLGRVGLGGPAAGLVAGLVESAILAPSEPEGPVEIPVEVDFAAAVVGAYVELQRPDGERYQFCLPAGVEDGERLRVPIEGLEVILVVRVLPHPWFRRVGHDLHVAVPVTLDELRKGERIEVPTPRGRAAFKLPEFSLGGQVFRLRGLGVQRGETVGDLYVRAVPADDVRAGLRW